MAAIILHVIKLYLILNMEMP